METSQVEPSGFDALSSGEVPLWLLDLVGAAWAARESFRRLGPRYELLEQAIDGLPDHVRDAVPVLANETATGTDRPSRTSGEQSTRGWSQNGHVFGSC